MVTDPHELPLVNSLDAATPALRRELSFRPQSFGKEDCYVVEDPVCAKFFRIGLDEYTFISMLDGETTVGEALQATRAARPDCVFTPSDAIAICRWVVRTALAHDGTVDAASLPKPGAETAAPRRRGARLSPLSIQLPLFHPDRFFERLRPWFGWCFSFPAFIVWLLIAGWAIADLVVQSQRLSESSAGILAASNWIWLGAAWIVLKVIHECSHAIACKRLGGDVREAGLILILFAPLAYVDVTSSWRLRSKWARIQVAAAGMYVEVFVAAVATLVWCRTSPGTLNHLCFNVMMTASVMTVLFNANPLMRFDGYYILSDFLELPNLYSLGQQVVGHVTRRYLFGIPSTLPDWPKIHGLIIRTYGLCSLFWRNAVFFGLVLSAATLFQGAGIALSALALLLWCVTMIGRLVRFARHRPNHATPNWPRFAVVGGGGLALTTSLLFVVPWPGAVTAPAVIRYSPRTVVRTESDGFVREIHVHSGKGVQKGQVIVVLANDALEQELAELELSIRESQLHRRIHQRKSELAKAQAESENLRALEKQRVQKQHEVDRLVVSAPHSGDIIGRKLETLIGTYLPKGSEILSIGREQSKEIRLSIKQDDIDAFRTHQGNSLRAYFPDTTVLESTLSDIEPRASVVPIDPSLCAPNGGSLAVRAIHDKSARDDRTASSFELLVPHFAGTISLNPAQSHQVFAGQRTRVALRPYESVGKHLCRALTDWIDSRLRRRHRGAVAHANRG